jgi:hypothetical protein
MLTATWDRLSPIESEVLELVDLFRYCAAPRRLERHTRVSKVSRGSNLEEGCV